MNCCELNSWSYPKSKPFWTDLTLARNLIYDAQVFAYEISVRLRFPFSSSSPFLDLVTTTQLITPKYKRIMHSIADWDPPRLEALTEGIKFLQTIAEGATLQNASLGKDISHTSWTFTAECRPILVSTSQASAEVRHDLYCRYRSPMLLPCLSPEPQSSGGEPAPLIDTAPNLPSGNLRYTCTCTARGHLHIFMEIRAFGKSTLCQQFAGRDT